VVEQGDGMSDHRHRTWSTTRTDLEFEDKWGHERANVKQQTRSAERWAGWQRREVVEGKGCSSESDVGPVGKRGCAGCAGRRRSWETTKRRGVCSL